MNKRVLNWSIIAIFLMFSAFIDYKGYDLDFIVNEVLSDITYLDVADYVVEYQYDKGRFIIYSGQVYNPDNRGPFIVLFF